MEPGSGFGVKSLVSNLGSATLPPLPTQPSLSDFDHSWTTCCWKVFLVHGDSASAWRLTHLLMMLSVNEGWQIFKLTIRLCDNRAIDLTSQSRAPRLGGSLGQTLRQSTIASMGHGGYQDKVLTIHECHDEGRRSIRVRNFLLVVENVNELRPWAQFNISWLRSPPNLTRVDYFVGMSETGVALVARQFCLLSRPAEWNAIWILNKELRARALPYPCITFLTSRDINLANQNLSPQKPKFYPQWATQ